MIAVVLVGGFGTRLRPLTLTTPKALLPIAGRRMLDRIVDQLAAGGISEIVLALGFKTDAFSQAYPTGICAGLPMRAFTEPEPLDTAGAIAFAARAAGLDSQFVVVNGDILTDLNVVDLVAAHNQNGARATLHLVPVEDPSSFGVADLDEQSRIRRFVEKPARGSEPSKMINAGTYVLEADVLDLIPVNGRCSVEREVFPALACTGQLFGFAHDVYWLDTGRPESLLQANEDIFAGRRPGVVAVDHPDVTVAPSATVIGTALPAGSSIASDATVIDSVLLDGARIGPGAVVRRSLVGRMAVVASGSQVDNTVLGDGARTEPGEQLDQARRPEQQV